MRRCRGCAIGPRHGRIGERWMGQLARALAALTDPPLPPLPTHGVPASVRGPFGRASTAIVSVTSSAHEGSVPPTRTRSDLGMGVMGISLPASVAIIGRRMTVRQKERSAFSILAAAGHLRECSFECTSSEATPTPG